MSDWIETHIPPWVWITLVAHVVVLGTVAYLILLERKVASWVQDRVGPNRVGLGFGIIPFLKDRKMGGLGQPLADGMKFVLKEDYRPSGVDKYLFTVAPLLMIVVVIVSIAVIPWGGVREAKKSIVLGSWVDGERAVAGDEPGMYEKMRDALPPGVKKVAVDYWNADGVQEGNRVINAPAGETPRHFRGADVTYRYPFQIADLNIGVLFILVFLSLAVYGVVVGGWASNNKYSFLGGLRATANMISYEIPLGLAVLCIVLMFGTLDLGVIVDKQAHYWIGFVPAWNVFTQPVAFLLFLVCIHAEANRAPFDIAEAEQELVGGYHTEYSSMRFALFFLAEYAGMITTSAVCVALFFGGWHLPWLEWAWPALRGDVDPARPELTSSLAAALVRSGVFFAKTLVIIFIFMWVRWSLPRFRFDQIMMLAWRALIPISLALLMMTAVVVYLTRHMDHAYDRISGRAGVIYLLGNALLVAGTFVVSLLIPPAPETNRRVNVPNSRFRRTPLPGGKVSEPRAELQKLLTTDH